jgi:hypothetical protein
VRAKIIQFDASRRTKPARQQTTDTERAQVLAEYIASCPADIQEAVAQYAADSDAHMRAVAARLGTDLATLERNGSRLYYHSDALLAIESAYGIPKPVGRVARRKRDAGREAVLNALFQYFEDGYASGMDDAQIAASRNGGAQ